MGDVVRLFLGGLTPNVLGCVFGVFFLFLLAKMAYPPNPPAAHTTPKIISIGVHSELPDVDTAGGDLSGGVDDDDPDDVTVKDVVWLLDDFH